MKGSTICRIALVCLLLGIVLFASVSLCFGQAWSDNTTNVSNDDQTNNVRRSTHYRICWGKEPTSTIPLTEEFIQCNLQNLEYVWKRENGPTPYGIAFHSPSVPNPPDGNHYKDNLYILNTHGNNTEGFAFGWTDGRNLGEFSICAEGLAYQDDPSSVIGHEYGHGCIISAAESTP